MYNGILKWGGFASYARKQSMKKPYYAGTIIELSTGVTTWPSTNACVKICNYCNMINVLSGTDIEYDTCMN